MCPYVAAIQQAEFVRRIGRVCRLSGLVIESEGPAVAVGDVCEISGRNGTPPIAAEVVGLKHGNVLLMPYGETTGIQVGSEVVARSEGLAISTGDHLLGRVIDGLGNPLDARPLLVGHETRSLRGEPLNPLSRPRIGNVLETGVCAIDTMLTIGRGQRVGIFAGSGVGKSTLLGMIARSMKADVNVIALIGERGREVRDFVEESLGHDGLSRSVVVAATSDQPALVRLRAAFAATAIAEHFREQGRHVLLMMDSVTRFAMAKREIGLSVGEPPTSRGYTPSVFADLPKLMERCGTAESGGSITALYTVLVEGDDLNDPVADAVRSILDGHIVLSRELANHGHYPAIDLLHSISRLYGDLAGGDDQAIAKKALAALSLHEKNRQMVDIGAYRSGTNLDLDRALKLVPELNRFFQQAAKAPMQRADALKALRKIVTTYGG